MKYIEAEKAISAVDNRIEALMKDPVFVRKNGNIDLYGLKPIIESIPAADVVPEEDVLKFYYVRSIDAYWLGRRVGNFYFAEYVNGQWVWTHSRYLPWGEHVVASDTLWKEHTYPSKPEEIPFEEWLKGFVKKNVAYSDRPTAHWIFDDFDGDGFDYQCSWCRLYSKKDSDFCPNCGADMRSEVQNHHV